MVHPRASQHSLKKGRRRASTHQQDQSLLFWENKMTTGRLLVCMFLTNLSKTDSGTVAWWTNILFWDLFSQPCTVQLTRNGGSSITPNYNSPVIYPRLFQSMLTHQLVLPVGTTKQSKCHLTSAHSSHLKSSLQWETMTLSNQQQTLV